MQPERHSASAAGAELRWSEQHPDDEDVMVPEPPAAPVDENAGELPHRRSTHAEAAALKQHHRETSPDD